MRIIKPEVSPEYLVRADCTACRAQIDYEQREGKLVYDDRDGDYFSFTCPCCGGTINVDRKLAAQRAERTGAPTNE